MSTADFSPEAVALANRIAKRSATSGGKLAVAVVCERHLTGCALYLGAALGCEATAEILYRLGDFFAVQKGAMDGPSPLDDVLRRRPPRRRRALPRRKA